MQGHYRNRATLWHTTDGETFEGGALGGRGERFATVRPVASGFAAAGSRSVNDQPGAVVWLSHDGEDWQAVPVPSDRRLVGADVMEWDGRLVVAATSLGDAEVWILENPAELLTTADGAS